MMSLVWCLMYRLQFSDLHPTPIFIQLHDPDAHDRPKLAANGVSSSTNPRNQREGDSLRWREERERERERQKKKKKKKKKKKTKREREREGKAVSCWACWGKSHAQARIRARGPQTLPKPCGGREGTER